jgi:YidC/Oxa1 family membrane protein insertase
VSVDFIRDGIPRKVEVALRRRPLELIRPEGDDPLSFLSTVHQVGNDRLPLEVDDHDAFLAQELPGVNLRQGTWEVVRTTSDEAVFRRVVDERNIEVIKTYRLAEVPTEEHDDRLYKAYHLVLDLEVRNLAEQPQRVAYQLDGPTGLPVEGWWYANKIGRSWSGVGLRDVVVSFNGGTPNLIGAPTIAEGDAPAPWQDEPLRFIGVDAQYFSAILSPKKKDPNAIWLASSQAIRVGPVDEDRLKLTDTSCRLVSQLTELPPGESLRHSYQVFAGPKRPALMAEYDLNGIIYYGWFGFIAVPMLHLLHFFHGFVFNYGIAIIMLTVVVRSLMFPLSRKQALNAQKMAELQPEIKKIQEKYKKDMEARTKAQQELFRKHNYNPLSGCLPMFIQLPIFIALYRSLMVDIELRQAPLLTSSIRWCSNLAAPDMLFDWSAFMPEFITSGVGMFGLGPYFNILPLLTVGLFIWQQKMFMPPPADEQAAMQQKMMQYMMIFFGILFFKVASGLCIYFIASSLWGLSERKWLPKPKAKPAGAADGPAKSDESPMARLRDAIGGGGDGQNGSGAKGKNKKKAKGKR